MDAKTFWIATSETYKKFRADEPFQKAAAVSYFALLSIAPLLLIAVSIAGFLFGEKAAEGQLVDDLSGLMGEQSATTIQTIIDHASTRGKGLFSLVSGVIMLLVGATSVFSHMQTALNQIWDVRADLSKKWVRRYAGQQLLLITMVFGVGGLLLLSLTVSAVLPVLKAYGEDLVPGSIIIWQWVNVFGSFALIAVALALLFKYLSPAKHGWREVWFGAIFTAVLFTLGNVVIGFYLGKTSIASSFGAAGSVVVLMVWTYYNSLLIFLGAEMIDVFARHIWPNFSDGTRS